MKKKKVNKEVEKLAFAFSMLTAVFCLLIVLSNISNIDTSRIIFWILVAVFFGFTAYSIRKQSFIFHNILVWGVCLLCGGFMTYLFVLLVFWPFLLK